VQTADFERAMREALGRRFDRSMLGTYFEAFAAAGEAADFVDQSVAARAAVERIFGVRMLERRVSRCWMGPLLAEVLGGAERFFECYNLALAEYRRAHAVRGHQRPIPDLARDGDRLEMPFWVMRPGEARQRLFIQLCGDSVGLYAGQRSVGCVRREELQRWAISPEAMEGCPEVVFRPRALTLTLWARMLLADLFMHGIGGAKYDRITDLLIRSYFGVEPPPMGCVSATLRLDLPRHGVSPRDQRALMDQRRDLIWNPQRHLAAGSDIDELIAARARAVEQSRSLRQANGRHQTRRREVFNQIRSINHRLLELRPEALGDLEQRIQRAQRALQEDEIATRRDYFFVMYDRAALERLCGALPGVGDFRL
jgi:hypothetical protein